MSDWDYAEVGGQRRWTIQLPGGVGLRIYLNPGETGDAIQGGPYHWHVVVGEHVVDFGPAPGLPEAQRYARLTLICFGENLTEAARRIGQ